MKRYTNLLEEVDIDKVSRKVFKHGIGNFMTGAAIGGMFGNTIGGAIGVLYGVAIYTTKKRTIAKLNKKIASSKISAYKRRQYIDMKNLFDSMSETEFREYILKNFYTKGAFYGSTAGSLAGGYLGKRVKIS